MQNGSPGVCSRFMEKGATTGLFSPTANRPKAHDARAAGNPKPSTIPQVSLAIHRDTRNRNGGAVSIAWLQRGRSIYCRTGFDIYMSCSSGLTAPKNAINHGTSPSPPYPCRASPRCAERGLTETVVHGVRTYSVPSFSPQHGHAFPRAPSV